MLGISSWKMSFVVLRLIWLIWTTERFHEKTPYGLNKATNHAKEPYSRYCYSAEYPTPTNRLKLYSWPIYVHSVRPSTLHSVCFSPENNCFSRPRRRSPWATCRTASPRCVSRAAGSPGPGRESRGSKPGHPDGQSFWRPIGQWPRCPGPRYGRRPTRRGAPGRGRPARPVLRGLTARTGSGSAQPRPKNLLIKIAF